MAVDFLLSNQFTVCLLVGASSTLTFKVLVEKYVVIFILLLTGWWL